MTVWAVAALAILVGTVLQRVSGTGVGLVCAPILALILGSGQGVLVTNATTTISGLLIGLSVRRLVDRRLATTICLSAVPGAIAGALLVRDLPVAWLQVVIGGIVLLAIVTSVLTPRLPHWPGRGAQVVAGLIGGLFNTTAGVAAPAMVVYSRLARFDQRVFAATLQPIFMTMGAMSVLLKTLLASTAGDFPPWWFAIVVVAMVGVGIRLGTWAAERVTPAQARGMALVLAGLGGALTLGRGLLALM